MSQDPPSAKPPSSPTPAQLETRRQSPTRGPTRPPQGAPPSSGERRAQQRARVRLESSSPRPPHSRAPRCPQLLAPQPLAPARHSLERSRAPGHALSLRGARETSRRAWRAGAAPRPSSDASSGACGSTRVRTCLLHLTAHRACLRGGRTPRGGTCLAVLLAHGVAPPRLSRGVPVIERVRRYLRETQEEYERTRVLVSEDRERLAALLAAREAELALPPADAAHAYLQRILEIHGPGQYARVRHYEFVVCRACGPFTGERSVAGHRFPCPTAALAMEALTGSPTQHPELRRPVRVGPRERGAVAKSSARAAARAAAIVEDATPRTTARRREAAEAAEAAARAASATSPRRSRASTRSAPARPPAPPAPAASPVPPAPPAPEPLAALDPPVARPRRPRAPRD